MNLAKAFRLPSFLTFPLFDLIIFSKSSFIFSIGAEIKKNILYMYKIGIDLYPAKTEVRKCRASI